jgi:hypothetical protein
MKIQYIADKSGQTIAVLLRIPIDEWMLHKKKYKEFEDEENSTNLRLLEWQVELGRTEIENIANGSAELLDWDEARKEFKL